MFPKTIKENQAKHDKIKLKKYPHYANFFLEKLTTEVNYKTK